MSADTKTCPHHTSHIVSDVRLGDINPGYLPHNLAVVERYVNLTGCVRMHAAKSVVDVCSNPGFHAVPRTYYQRDPIELAGLGRANLYQESTDVGLVYPYPDRRLFGWRAILPEVRDISPFATDVSFVLDYEPNRDPSNVSESVPGDCNLLALFDLRHPQTDDIHSAKVVLDYNPNDGHQTYKSLRISVYNRNTRGKPSHFHDKIDIINRPTGAMFRLQLGRADLGSDTDFARAPSLYGLSCILEGNNQTAKVAKGGILRSKLHSYDIEYVREPEVRHLNLDNDGVCVIEHTPMPVVRGDVPYWNTATRAHFDTSNNRFGFSSNDVSLPVRWSVPLNILDQFPLPVQDYRWSSSEEQIRDLLPQLTTTFCDFVYNNLNLDENGLSVNL